MSVLNRLAHSLGRRDEVPNQELAKAVAKKKDKKAVKELIDNLSNKDKNIQADCIKTLYEIGYINPELIADYADVFLDLLDHKNNRLVWGAMTALDDISRVNPKGIYKALPKIMRTADEGSVITRDHCVNILIRLCAFKPAAENAFELLLEQFKTAPTNQLPKYAEDAQSIIPKEKKAIVSRVLASRLKEIEKDSKRKRVEKVIKKLS